MKGLDGLMRKTSLNNWIKGFNIKNRANVIMQLTHLLYADATLLFSEAKHEQICYLRAILVVLEACSVLK